MIRKLIRSGVAAMLLVAGPALAADMPYTPPTPPPAALFNWNGFYAGLHAGWIWGSSDFGDADGGALGGQIGYNWQGPSGLIGVEVDSAWAGIKETASTVLPVIGPVTAKFKADYEGSLRLRLGTPVDNTLYFVTGGLAWMHAEFSGSALGFTASDSNTHLGWTAGVGIEHAYSPNWTGRIEYRYTDYGSKDYFRVPFKAQTHMVKLAVNYLTH